jgi:hypothetical protein
MDFRLPAGIGTMAEAVGGVGGEPKARDPLELGPGRGEEGGW